MVTDILELRKMNKPRVVQVCSKDPVTGEVHCYDKIVDDGEPND